MNTPLVSVCVTTYNQDRYIEDCLVSVLMQLQDAALEILVGDDGVGEETPHIIGRLMVRYPGVIRYFRHEKNLGPSANYQFLVRAARGHYIAHLDGDDFWLPGKIRAQLQWMTVNPDSTACYTNAVVVSDDRKVRGVFCSEIEGPVSLEYLLVKGNFLNHSSMLYRAKYKSLILDIAGPFIDYRMHLNFAKLGPLGFNSAAYVAYRLDSEYSMIRKTPGLVQNLYFEAMVSVLSDAAVSVFARRSSLRHFWRAIALETLAHGRFAWAGTWARTVFARYPADAWVVLSKGAVQAACDLFALVIYRFSGWLFQSNNLRILHKR